MSRTPISEPMSRQLAESRRDWRNGHGGPDSSATKSVPVAAVDFDRIVREVRSVLEPAAIVLFGSYARGDFGPFSDIDLLVVRAQPFARGESRRRELGSLYRALASTCELPKDILLFTRDEVAAWKETTNHMVAMAAKEGRVLYGQL